jgi:hypothetical protein
MDSEHTWEAQYPDYWIEQNNQVNSYVLEDAIGVVFFVKSIRHMGGEIEISLQFDRMRGMVSKTRVMGAMAAGFSWLKKALPMNGFSTVYFVSKNQDLIVFAEKGLGFVKDGIRHVHKFVTEEVTDGKAHSKSA